MSWSIEEHIGEGRPWPEQVVVYRGETDESLTYARRSLSDVNQMVELMDTLAAENAKLRRLVMDYNYCILHVDCAMCKYKYGGTMSKHCPLSPCFPDIDELGIEVDE